MSITAYDLQPAEPLGKSAVHRLTLALVWLAVALSAVVFSEPAPFDLLMMGLIVLLPMIGLCVMTPSLVALSIGWLLVAVGGFLASIVDPDMPASATHAFITLYLSFASVVIAGFVLQKPVEHTRLMMNAYLVAAVIATVAALIGYFGIVPQLQELFTGFGRARGTFKDPNVYGAFLAPAIGYAIYLWYGSGGLRSLVPLAASVVLVLGALLSFSRGAWFNAVLVLAVFGYLSFVTARTGRQQVRLFTIAVVGLLGVAAVLLVALQFDEVADLMQQRASLEQSYDVGPQGRFGGQAKALGLIQDHPLGIGAKVFSSTYHHEDVHNVYLSMFLNAGWIGGFAYLAVVLATLAVGVAAVLQRSEFQSLTHMAFAAFVGQAGESLIIDSDHWRHYFILLGLIWGLSLATLRTTRH